jgi:hypothetical protein
VHFPEAGVLTLQDLTAVQQQVRARVLRWFARASLLERAGLECLLHLSPPDRQGPSL